jgi:hypothetical protein
MAAFTLSEAAINVTVTGAEKVKAALGGILGILNPLGFSLKTLAIGGGLAAGIGFAAKKAMDLEEALDDMRDVLAATGQDVESGMARFHALEKALWSISNTSRETTRGLMQIGLEMGLTAEQAERLTAVSVTWSKRAGVEPQEGLRMLQALLAGKTKALDKMYPAIARVSSIEEKWKVVMDMARQGTDMLAGDLETTKGAFDHMLGSINNLYTKMGENLLPVIKYVASELDNVINWLEALMITAQEFINLRWGTEIKTMSDWVEALKEGFNKFFTQVGEKLAIITYAIINWNESFEIVKAAFNVLVMYMYDLFQWLGKMVEKIFDDVFKKMFDALVSKASEAILALPMPDFMRDEVQKNAYGQSPLNVGTKEAEIDAFMRENGLIKEEGLLDKGKRYGKAGMFGGMGVAGEAMYGRSGSQNWDTQALAKNPALAAKFNEMRAAGLAEQKAIDERKNAMPTLSASSGTIAAEAALKKATAGQQEGINKFLDKLKDNGPMGKDAAKDAIKKALEGAAGLPGEVGKKEKEDKVSWTALGDDWKKMQSGIMGGDDPQKKTAENTTEMAKTIKSLYDWFTAGAKNTMDSAYALLK